MQSTFIGIAAAAALAVAVTGGAARAAASDKLTGLPLYPDAPFTMDLPASTYCGDPFNGTMYMPGGKVTTIVKWYAAHLPGFHFTHAFVGDRTQDTFAKPDGRIAATVTGVPGSSGNVYAISYVKFARPLGLERIDAINKHDLSCR